MAKQVNGWVVEKSDKGFKLILVYKDKRYRVRDVYFKTAKEALKAKNLPLA